MLGDAKAQLDVAWEYYHGVIVNKNVSLAISMLRELERSSPEVARFHIAKIKLLENDSSFAEEIRSDCAAGFGPSLYLMGAALKNNLREGEDLSEAVRYFSDAADVGHLPSQILAWRLGERSRWKRFITIIPVLKASIRMVVVRAHDVNDIRALT